MREGSVIFKATSDGLVLVMREEDDFESVVRMMEKKLDSAGKFFKGASISVRYRGKTLEKEQEKALWELMKERTGADIRSFEKDTSSNLASQECKPEAPSARMVMKKLMNFKGLDEGITKFYKGTIRSGQMISFDGNLVVLGDVNPGGKLEASGNVVVMGSLRGTVHAGADGNRDAIVVAYNLQPMQLRIADVIARSPDEKGDEGMPIPEMAYIKDERVYIERFLPLPKQSGTL
jgi:septum site-determining protein MinC